MLLLAPPALAALPCDAPATAEEARALRADQSDFVAEGEELRRIVAALADEPDCPSDVWLEGYAPNWFGGCETTSGYAIEVEGVYGGAYDETWLWWDLEIVATERADGSLPEGVFDLDMSGRSSSSNTSWGSSETWTATWTIQPTSSTVLRPEATLTYAWSSSSFNGCSTANTRYETTVDGCGLSGESFTMGALATHSLVGDSWALEVATSVCGSTLANDTFVDPDTWAAVARTDADGDGCAVEDCDCDDADPAVSPLAIDVAGDGADADCDGHDDDHDATCNDTSYTCAPPAQDDTAPTDTASTDTAPPDTPTPTSPGESPTPNACGCASSTSPFSPSPAWFGLLAALGLRRRR